MFGSHEDRPRLVSHGSQRRRVPPIAVCGRSTIGVRWARLHRRRSVTWATRSGHNRPTADAILLRWDHRSSTKQRRPGCRKGHHSAAETGRRQPRSPRLRYRAGADAGLATGSRRRTCCSRQTRAVSRRCRQLRLGNPPPLLVSPNRRVTLTGLARRRPVCRRHPHGGALYLSPCARARAHAWERSCRS